MAKPLGEWSLGRRPGLDGVRGIAILMVLVGHVFPHRFANGGAAGVTVFFALSGFLITSLLLEEFRGTRDISFKRFYERRARRLLPALVVYLAAWTLLSASHVGPYRVAPGEVIAALLYFMNWVMAHGIAVSHPMGITWSLSVEEQFYLLWPLAFLLARRWPRAPLTIAVLGVVYALATRVATWGGPAAGSIYYRTDTRMDSLMVGCLLAIAVHHRGLPRRLSGLATASTVVLMVLFLAHGEQLKLVLEPFLVAVAACGLIAACLVHEIRWLAWAPLRWFGKRSYALYLWHYPLVVLAWDDIREIPMWLAVGLALIAAELSWWLVERPFRARGTREHEPDGGPQRVG